MSVSGNVEFQVQIMDCQPLRGNAIGGTVTNSIGPITDTFFVSSAGPAVQGDNSPNEYFGIFPIRDSFKKGDQVSVSIQRFDCSQPYTLDVYQPSASFNYNVSHKRLPKH